MATSPVAPAPPSGEVSYVQSLLGTAAPQGPAPEPTPAPGTGEAKADQTPAQTGTAPEQPPAAETKPPEEPSAPAKPLKPEVEELIKEFAEEYGVDSNDPAQRRHLKRLADKELFIRTLQAKLDEQGKQLTSKPSADAAGLTEYERALLAEASEGTDEGETKPESAPAEKETPAPPAEVTPPPVGIAPLGDVGDQWRNALDGYKALEAAWEKGDHGEVNQIELALWRRRFLGMGLPVIREELKEFKKAFRTELEQSFSDVRTTAQERRRADNREFAVAELSKVPDLKDVIPALFKVEEGPPINYEGEEFPNTPLNRVFVEHPELLDIRVDDPDPDKAQRLTFIRQYRAAARIYARAQQSGGIPSDKAKALVQAGAKMHAREQDDRARQTINAGTGATGGLAGKAGEASYVQSLNALPGEIPMSALLSGNRRNE